MSFLSSQSVRSDFIKFFERIGHKFVPSSPVVPQDDPTLLFTNAGMNQFKPIFLGTEKRDYLRAVNSQKCIRVSGKHNDLEEVGHDTYHHTFFEMLGNWSFGDYYKEEAIRWAWELLTKGWGLPKERLYATVYKEDDDAERLWKNATDIEPSHVLRFGEQENFWEMGDTGPCGPCSEIHIDLTENNDGMKLVNAGSPEVIELWNLVFIQYNRSSDSSLTLLPSKHVDTGAGFERLTRVLQQKSSNYDIDLFRSIIRGIEIRTKKTYDESEQQAAFRVIADHVRMLTFSITDGAVPGNEGRGYVLRRILRRAAMYGRKLDMHQPFLFEIVPHVVSAMGNAFPEIEARQGYVERIIRSEEDHFNATLDRGLEVFEDIARGLRSKGIAAISGDDAFKLYDTFGFPLDLTRVMAQERKLGLDEAGFNKVMDTHRQRSRDEGKKKFISENVKWIESSPQIRTVFLGYDLLETTASLTKYSIDNNQARLVFDQTPFYPEAGGQIGDKGSAIFETVTVDIWDTQRVGDDIVHFADAPEGLDLSGVRLARLAVHTGSRVETMKNHSATHLLHAALRRVLGTHVQQAGSAVDPDRLRFDFTHFEKLLPEQLSEIERIVNDKIRENLPLIHHRNIPIADAKAMGALSFFGDKYGDNVNVIQFGDFSKEFCGGTHAQSTGVLGNCRIVSESGISSGVRRLEAVTGRVAEKWILDERQACERLRNLLNISTDDLVVKITSLIEENKYLQKAKNEMQLQLFTRNLDHLIASAQYHNGLRVVTSIIELPDSVDVKDVGDQLRNRLGSGIGVLAVIKGQTGTLLCVVTDDLVQQKRYHAGNLVKELAALVGGSGGGRPGLATAGIKDPFRVEVVFNRIHEIVG